MGTHNSESVPVRGSESKMLVENGGNMEKDKLANTMEKGKDFSGRDNFHDFDDFLSYIGGFGKYQRLAQPLIWLVSIPFGFHMVAMVFVAYEPDFHCVPPSRTNQSWEAILNSTIPWEGRQGEMHRSQCHMRGLTSNDSTTTIGCVAWQYDQTDMSSTITIQWNLVCDRKWLQAQAQSIFMAGFMVGCFFFGDISDRFGRLLTILVCTGLQVAAALGVAFAPNLLIFTILRFLVGAFTAGQKNSSYVMSMELVGLRWREVISLMNEPFFTTGYLLVGVAAYATRDWHKTQLAIAIPPLIFLAYYWWQLSKNQTCQALQTARRMAKTNGVYVPEHFTIGFTEKKQSRNVLDLFRTRRLFTRTILLLYIWFVNSFVFYGLAFSSTHLAGNMYMNYVISGVVELPGYFLAMVFVKMMGRRFTLGWGLVLAGASCVSSSFVPPHMWPLSVTLTMLGKMAISGTLALMYMYTSELYPTTVRNLAVGTGNMVSKLGATLTPFVTMLSMYYANLPVIVFGSTAAVAGVIMFFLPETRGQPLPDTFEEAEQLGRKYPVEHSSEDEHL